MLDKEVGGKGTSNFAKKQKKWSYLKMHKKLMTLVLAAAFAIGTGCAPKSVVKNWEAAGGSRADATVEVGFTYYPQSEKPEMSEAQAQAEALRRCQAWGYTDAEPFGLVKEQCQRQDFVPFVGLVCGQMLVTRQYQCLGQGNVDNSIAPKINR